MLEDSHFYKAGSCRNIKRSALYMADIQAVLMRYCIVTIPLNKKQHVNVKVIC